LSWLVAVERQNLKKVSWKNWHREINNSAIWWNTGKKDLVWIHSRLSSTPPLKLSPLLRQLFQYSASWSWNVQTPDC
jgi:hypothetical protein